jgi:hypothetical protein
MTTPLRPAYVAIDGGAPPGEALTPTMAEKGLNLDYDFYRQKEDVEYGFCRVGLQVKQA